MRKQILVLFLLMLSGLISCHKKDPEPATRTELLTNKKWQLRSGVLSYPGQPDQDFYSRILSCALDDFEEFTLPNTSMYDEGLTKCSQYNSQTTLGLWSLSNNDTQLNYAYGGISYVYTIIELTDTSLKMTAQVPQSNGTYATNTFVYAVIK